MFAVHQRASANYSPGGSPERTSLSLAHQGAFHPGSGFVRRCEQGRVAGIALAETGFQVPAPLVLRVMALAIEADDHGGELIIDEDKVALAVMTINEHAHRLERDVEGHSLRLPVGAKGHCQAAGHPEMNLYG